MQAEELRINNFVLHKGGEWSDRNPRVEEKDFVFQWEESDWYSVGECTLSLDQIEPIPLTEEWLLKFSFEKEDEEYFHKSKYAPVLIECDNGWADSFEERQASKIINYVHQLQNLFYALTGEELTLK